LLFFNTSVKNPTFPFDPLLRLLNRSNLEWYTSSKASSILAILMESSHDLNDDIVRQMCVWLREQLRKSDVREMCNAVVSMQKLLGIDKFRVAFAAEDGLALLIALVKSKAKNYQIMYQLVYCFWLLSYNAKVAGQMNETQVVPTLIELLKTVATDKVIRVVVATLRNLVTVSPNHEPMLECGIMKPLDILLTRTWGDEDIEEDLKYLSETLQKSIAVLSTFDQYKKELLSGNLEWSPPHKSEKFWKENLYKFEEENYKLLLVLRELLTSSHGLIVSVACFDLGEFARFHPRGKHILTQLNIKLSLMKLMEDKDIEVKKHALTAIQKLMASNSSSNRI